MRQIYFAGSIRGGRGDRGLYLQIIELLKKYGQVLTEHVGDPTLTHHGETNVDDEEIYLRDTRWLKMAQVLVAEVTIPSHGVGYEICKMEEYKNPILCLYREVDGCRVSPMISGNKNLRIKTVKYTDIDEAEKILADFFSQLPPATEALTL